MFKFWRGKREDEEEYIEVEDLESEEKIKVKVSSIDSLKDVGRIQELVRSGYIVFAYIKDLKERDMEELKRAVERIRMTCTAIDGDLVGVDDDYLIITPTSVKVAR